MGHSPSKLRRQNHHNQNLTQNPSHPPDNSIPSSPSSSPSSTATTVIDIDSNSTTFNTSFNGGNTTLSSQPHASSYVFEANAPHPSPSPPPAPFFSTSSPNHYHPPPSVMAPVPFFSLAPPPYVDHTSAKKIKNDVNIHKDTIGLFLDDNNLDSHLVSFTFDALVDGCVTIFYFAKEGPNCTFMPLYPDIYMPMRIPFQKGLAQKFCQPSGTGIDLGFFELGRLSRPSRKEDIFPLVISAEASFPSPPTMSPHAQITQAVLKQDYEGRFEVKVIKQILWNEGIRYELREIYGIENCSEPGLDDSESGKACVICMNEPKDTAALPCRHMCMCSGCAKQLRLQSKRCPVCRQSIQELIEIKIKNQPKSAVQNDSRTESTGLIGQTHEHLQVLLNH